MAQGASQISLAGRGGPRQSHEEEEDAHASEDSNAECDLEVSNPKAEMSKINGRNPSAAVASLKAACLDSVENSKNVAKNADDGRRVIGSSNKFGSAKEAKEAKIEAAKAKRAAKEAEAKAAGK
eukprot:gene15496-21578_t